MKTWKLLFVAMIAVLIFGFSGCDLFELLFGAMDLEVRLESEGSRTEVKSDEPIKLNAIVVEAEGFLTFDWYINGTLVGNAHTAGVWYRGLAEGNRDVDIRVVAIDTDSDAEGEASLTLRVQPSASLRIDNQSTISVLSLGLRLDGAMDYDNYMSSGSLGSPGMLTIFNIPAGNYDFRASNGAAFAGSTVWTDELAMARYYPAGRPLRATLGYGTGAVGDIAWETVSDPKDEMGSGNPPWTIMY